MSKTRNRNAQKKKSFTVNESRIPRMTGWKHFSSSMLMVTMPENPLIYYTEHELAKRAICIDMRELHNVMQNKALLLS